MATIVQDCDVGCRSRTGDRLSVNIVKGKRKSRDEVCFVMYNRDDAISMSMSVYLSPAVALELVGEILDGVEKLGR